MQNTEEQKRLSKERYNKNIKKDRLFKVGDSVLLFYPRVRGSRPSFLKMDGCGMD